MGKSKVKKNVIIGFLGQFVILLLGMIFPRYILTSYGSDANGLISTITQIFAYMALLEAGIAQAAKNELYEHIIKDDKDQISIIATISKCYFHKITYWYGIGVLILSFVTPIFIKSNLEKSTIFFVVLFEGIAGVLTFYYVQTPVTLLSAFGKDYINNTVEAVNKGISYLVRIILACIGVDLFFLQLSYCIITICRSLFYTYYFKNKYKWLDLKKNVKKTKLRDKNAYVVNELAWTVFASTDNIILSSMIGTQIASVYAIYNMVFNALNTLLNAVYTSVSYMLGQAYHKELKYYEKIHDSFMSIFLGSMTIMMSIAYVLVVPFVRLYTYGISDVNYIYNSIPIFFCLIRILSWSRYVTGNLTGIAGYAKSTSVVSIIEATINIISSILLVKRMGIVGVLIGSVIALPIKIIYCAYIADKKVLKRSCKKTIVIYGINFLLFISVVIVSNSIPIIINSYTELIYKGIIVTIIIAILGIVLNSLANVECVKWLLVKLKKSKKSISRRHIT